MIVFSRTSFSRGWILIDVSEEVITNAQVNRVCRQVEIAEREYD